MTAVSAKLTKDARDALPEEDFAVPHKRQLPIHDEKHVRLAWDMVKHTHGLTRDERAEARRRIVERAHKFGVDTTGWKVEALSAAKVSLFARSLDISNGNHPNKMPFSGILTRIGEPSDAPPEGSGGRRVMLTREAAEQALDSLLGMAIDYDDGFSGHDPVKKIGIITGAKIEGNAICIDGFVYAADFPDVAAEIKARKSELGFSFEARDILTTDPNADPIPIVGCVFTGAAVLLKDNAAYRTTSIAASAATGEFIMDEKTKGEIDALITAGQKPIADAVATLAETMGKVSAAIEKMPGQISAANHLELIEPHAKRLEAAADCMEAAGLGGHPTRGHVAVLRHMAGSMRSDAAQGKMPHVYDGTGHYYAATDVRAGADKSTETAISAALSTALKPLIDSVASQNTVIKDLQAAANRASPAPERKTLPAEITNLLAKNGIKAPEGDEKVPVAKIDEVLRASNIRGRQAMEMKTLLARAGVID